MTPKARNVVIFCVVVFMILHHDFWLWEDKSLVFGFLPSGLAYHALYSIIIAVFWYLVVKFAWPQTLEEFAETGEDDEEGTQ